MKISGLILSGGRSSRMQANKAFVELNGQKIIEGV
ncbi:MAG: molybdenum cofactor guanylyltransferase, partial [Candidatus Saccharibacteria bacterium]